MVDESLSLRVILPQILNERDKEVLPIYITIEPCEARILRHFFVERFVCQILPLSDSRFIRAFIVRLFDGAHDGHLVVPGLAVALHLAELDGILDILYREETHVILEHFLLRGFLTLHPWMLTHLIQGWPLLWVLSRHLPDEVQELSVHDYVALLG